MKLFLDTNIVIDFLSGREPFGDDAVVTPKELFLKLNIEFE